MRFQVIGSDLNFLGHLRKPIFLAKQQSGLFPDVPSKNASSRIGDFRSRHWRLNSIVRKRLELAGLRADRSRSGESDSSRSLLCSGDLTGSGKGSPCRDSESAACRNWIHSSCAALKRGSFDLTTERTGFRTLPLRLFPTSGARSAFDNLHDSQGVSQDARNRGWGRSASAIRELDTLWEALSYSDMASVT